MILPGPTDAIHKAWMYRVLSAICDDPFLVKVLRFKGGTYAAMRGFIERFSLDLDFDLIEPDQLKKTKQHLEKLFKKLGLTTKDARKKVPQYFLGYPNKPNQRNTLKLDATFPAPKNNDYEAVRLQEIDRIIYGQTLPTLFANKLVAPLDRFERHGSIAGRDFFDLHVFFIKGYSYKPEITEERTGKKIDEFIPFLKNFIQEHLTQTVIDQDLNPLLDSKAFHRVRKVLKQELLMFLG